MQLLLWQLNSVIHHHRLTALDSFAKWTDHIVQGAEKLSRNYSCLCVRSNNPTGTQNFINSTDDWTHWEKFSTNMKRSLNPVLDESSRVSFFPLLTYISFKTSFTFRTQWAPIIKQLYTLLNHVIGQGNG